MPEENKTHRLKTHPTYFKMVADGSKTFELRKNDRDFKKGDALSLDEYEPVDSSYTGATLSRVVTGVMNIRSLLNLFPEADVILSIADPQIAELQRENEQLTKDFLSTQDRLMSKLEKLTQAQEQIVALRDSLEFYSDANRYAACYELWLKSKCEKPILLSDAGLKASQALKATTEQAEAIKREWLDKQLETLHAEIWLELYRSIHPDDKEYRRGINACLDIVIKQRKALQALKEGGE